MPAYDYSNAPPPRGVDLIPIGTIASVQLHIIKGDAGEDGLLTRSKDGGCEMLNIQFTVVDGPYAKRKIWVYWITSGTTAGHAEAAEITRGMLRNILESAHGVKSTDMSDEARKLRTAEFQDFDGLICIVKVGIEKGKARNDGSGENYQDKNVIAAVITPDRREWHAVEQPPPFNGGGGVGAGATAAGAAVTTPAAGIQKPKWVDESS
jgi:hypothetical protein